MNKRTQDLNPERQRLADQRAGKADWRLWGPYLSERAWGTVREDYSAQGTAWEHFDHHQSRSRAYRWNEDGLGGICDKHQRLCFALALWNGEDEILKERAFGLTGNQGNRGEDVKEYYFYTDALPSHSWLRYLYKYPQSAYPYTRLVEENRRRSRLDPSFNLLDSGVFEDQRYWDIDVKYAKVSPTQMQIRITANNRGGEEAELHLIPQLWFRNTWSWGDEVAKPNLKVVTAPASAVWAVTAEHGELGPYTLYGDQRAELLFTENETNSLKLWGTPAPSPYVKDAFHRRVVEGDHAAVNPGMNGSKFGAWYRLKVGAGESKQIDLILSAETLDKPFLEMEKIIALRRSEADIFYDELLPEGGPEDHRIMRQAQAGMIWSKQFFHYRCAALAGGRSDRRHRRNAQQGRNQSLASSAGRTTFSPCRTPGNTPGSPPGTWPFTVSPWP